MRPGVRSIGHGTRKFLAYSVTFNKSSKLKVAATSLNRLMAKVRELMRKGRGRSINRTEPVRISVFEA